MFITIHHECPCRVEISRPRCRNYNQGRVCLNIYFIHSILQRTIEIRVKKDAYQVLLKKLIMVDILKF